MAERTAVLPPIRCSQEEKEIIQTNADALHMSISEYVRSMAVSGGVHQSLFDVEFIHTLKMIGTDMHRQTQLWEDQKAMPAELAQTWARLDGVLNHIIKTMKIPLP